MKVVRADAGNAGSLVDWTLLACGWIIEIVRRPKGSGGFVLPPKRWVVERIFAWLYQHRRLSKDYEYLTKSSETVIYIAMIGIMLRMTRIIRLSIHALSNTIALGETTRNRTWVMPGTGSAQSDFKSGHGIGAHFLFCEGSVRFIGDSIDCTTFHSLLIPNGSETMTAF